METTKDQTTNPTGTERDVIVELTPLFAANDAITQACKQYAQPEVFLKLWCGLAKKTLQTAKFTKRSGKILSANRRVVVSQLTFGYMLPMINAGMITITEAGGVSELSQEDFDVFWGNYPTRLTNGHNVKVGKNAAAQVFFNEILTRDDFALLLKAVSNYKTVTSPTYIKDASRFLRSWRDYTDVKIATPKKTSPIIDQRGFDNLYGRSVTGTRFPVEE